jgi:Resolvase, N terminal domain
LWANITMQPSAVPTLSISAPAFAEMLLQLAANGAKTVIVESPDRFARDLAVQLAGHDMLKALGISIIAASAPDFFTEDTPTAVLVRQVLGAIAQFEKASSVAKLAAARKRKPEREGRCEEGSPSVKPDPRLSLWRVNCAGVGPRVGNCRCARCRSIWQLMAFSTTLASPTPRSLLRAYSASLAVD